jgi:hypothetical protein
MTEAGFGDRTRANHSMKCGCSGSTPASRASPVINRFGAWLGKRLNSRMHSDMAQASTIQNWIARGEWGRFIFNCQRTRGSAGRNMPRARPPNVVFSGRGRARPTGRARTGGPPYFGGVLCENWTLNYAAAGIWRPDFWFTRVFA